MVATKTSLSVRVDALTDADEKSTPSAPTIGLENRAKLEARLRALEAESDATGARRFATGPNQQRRIKPDPAVSTYNPAADAVGLVSTQRESMESAVKAVLDTKEEKRRVKEERRAKKRAEKEKVAAEDAVKGDPDAMEVDKKEEDEETTEEKKWKRRKSDGVTAVADGAAPMVRDLFLFLVVKVLNNMLIILGFLGRCRDGGRAQRTEAGEEGRKGLRQSCEGGREIFIEKEENQVRGIGGRSRHRSLYVSLPCAYSLLLVYMVSSCISLRQTIRLLRLSALTGMDKGPMSVTPRTYYTT